MAAKRSSDHTPGQLGLGLTGHTESIGIECRGLFSSIYLRKVLPSTVDYPTIEEVQPLYDSIKVRWLKHWLGMAKAKEAYTRSQFLDPLLKQLGWHFLPEQDLPPGQGGLRKRPDYCLCRDEASMTSAAEAGSPTAANTAMFQINDLRQMPFVIPTVAQAKRLRDLAERAMEAKQCEFANNPPSQALAAFCRVSKDELVAKAPSYLRPDAQEQLLDTPKSCLAVIELAVNWEAEKLYGVEGLGPFDDF